MTYLNFELKERVKYLERKYAELGARCGASQQDLNAVEIMVATNPHEIDARGQRNQNQSRADKHGDGKDQAPNSYDYYRQSQ